MTALALSRPISGAHRERPGHGFKIMAKRCDQCLYGANKVVSNARRAQILRDLTREDRHFTCHKSTIAGEAVACRGDWDQRGCGQMGRIAGRLGAVHFTDEHGLIVEPEGTR